MNVIFERLKSNIIPFPLVSDHRSDDDRFYAHKVDRNTALGMPMIQVNGPRCIRYLCFDIDRKLGGLAWEDANLPLPNLIMTNPKNGHAHLLYEIDRPIWKKRPDDSQPGDALPVRYMEAVYKAMGEALRADKQYNGLLVKNPLHNAWVVSCGSSKPYTLGELSRHLDLTTPKVAQLYEEIDGRNCTLFCSIRYHAYRIVDEYRYVNDFSGFSAVLLDELEKMNGEFPNPLPLNEIRGILKSVSKWTWKNYRGNGNSVRRGIMGLDASLPLQVRQQLSQQRTCQIRVEKTVRILSDCITRIQLEGKIVSISEVHRRTKLSRNTVRVYWTKLTGNNTEGTVSLRDRSPEVDTLIPTQLNIAQPPTILYSGESELFSTAGARTFESTSLNAVDIWRLLESSLYEQ